MNLWTLSISGLRLWKQCRREATPWEAGQDFPPGLLRIWASITYTSFSCAHVSSLVPVHPAECFLELCTGRGITNGPVVWDSDVMVSHDVVTSVPGLPREGGGAGGTPPFRRRNRVAARSQCVHPLVPPPSWLLGCLEAQDPTTAMLQDSEQTSWVLFCIFQWRGCFHFGEWRKKLHLA